MGPGRGWARHSIPNLERDVQGRGLATHHLLLLLELVAAALDRDTEANLRLLLVGELVMIRAALEHYLDLPQGGQSQPQRSS